MVDFWIEWCRQIPLYLKTFYDTWGKMYCILAYGMVHTLLSNFTISKIINIYDTNFKIVRGILSNTILWYITVNIFTIQKTTIKEKQTFKSFQSKFYLSTLVNKIGITRYIFLKYQMLHINYFDAEHIYFSLF